MPRRIRHTYEIDLYQGRNLTDIAEITAYSDDEAAEAAKAMANDSAGNYTSSTVRVASDMRRAAR